MRARLVSADGGPSIDLLKELTLFGRDEDSDVRLDHKGVSKLHCVIVKTDGLLLVRDLGSTNGTRVNGQRIRRAALLPNDTLAIANLKFVVKFGIELEKEGAEA
ncbi:MAG: FHA domain-containing protein, partial [Planctomycetia bacterium]|nr:FHA domain-containing protein [Planctomycetia bacterium]